MSKVTWGAVALGAIMALTACSNGLGQQTQAQEDVRTQIERVAIPSGFTTQAQEYTCDPISFDCTDPGYSKYAVSDMEVRNACTQMWAWGREYQAEVMATGGTVFFDESADLTDERFIPFPDEALFLPACTQALTNQKGGQVYIRGALDKEAGILYQGELHQGEYWGAGQDQLVFWLYANRHADTPAS